MPTIIIIVREKILNVKHFPTPLTDNDVKSFAEKNGITKKYVVRDKKDKILFPKDFPLNENVWINTHYDDINSDKYYYEKFRVTYGETEYCIRCIDYPDTYIMVNTNKNKIQRITKILNESKVIDMSLRMTNNGDEDFSLEEARREAFNKAKKKVKIHIEEKSLSVPFYIVEESKSGFCPSSRYWACGESLYYPNSEIIEIQIPKSLKDKVKFIDDKKKIENDIWSTD